MDFNKFFEDFDKLLVPLHELYANREAIYEEDFNNAMNNLLDEQSWECLLRK